MEVNSMIMELVNLQKLAINLIDFDKNSNVKNECFYENLKDYNVVTLKIRGLRKEIERLKIDETTYSSKKQYKEEFIKQSDDVLNFNKFVEICETYQQKALNYYYLISRDLRKEHADIINKIEHILIYHITYFNLYQNFAVVKI